jgi:hypothetical protein
MLEKKDRSGVSSTGHIVEALGLLKDWVTAILQLETAIIGAVGTAIALKTAPELTLSRLEGGAVAVAAACFGISIYCGLMVLNMLPGAAQREPPTGKDIYSIAIFTRTIGYWAKGFRFFFVCGVIVIIVFIILRATGF